MAINKTINSDRTVSVVVNTFLKPAKLSFYAFNDTIFTVITVTAAHLSS